MARPPSSVLARTNGRGRPDSMREVARRNGDFPGEPGGGGPVGPFGSEAEALGVLRDRLAAALKPCAIWLFGSRARRDPRPDSDFDLLVVLPDGLEPERYGYDAVVAPLAGCPLAFDLVPCSWSAFLRYRGQPGSFVHRIVAEGRPIYRDAALRRAAEREAA